jgi:hypothetical protein
MVSGVVKQMRSAVVKEMKSGVGKEMEPGAGMERDQLLCRGCNQLFEKDGINVVAYRDTSFRRRIRCCKGICCCLVGESTVMTRLVFFMKMEVVLV